MISNKIKRNILSIGLCLVFFTTLTIPSQVIFAQASSDNYAVLAPLPCIETSPRVVKDSTGQTITIPGVTCPGVSGATADTVNFKEYVQYTFNLLIALAAVTAVFMIVVGGFQYMTTTSPGGKSEGRDRVQNAVIGLLLILGSYLILRTVNPQFVEIPNTLVKPIFIECPGQPELNNQSKGGKGYYDPNCKAGKNAMTMMEQLQAQAERYSEEAEKYNEQVNEINLEQAELIKQKSILEAQLKEKLSSAEMVEPTSEIQMLQATLAAVNESINEREAEKIITMSRASASIKYSEVTKQVLRKDSLFANDINTDFKKIKERVLDDININTSKAATLGQHQKITQIEELHDFWSNNIELERYLVLVEGEKTEIDTSKPNPMINYGGGPGKLSKKQQGELYRKEIPNLDPKKYDAIRDPEMLQELNAKYARLIEALNEHFPK